MVDLRIRVRVRLRIPVFFVGAEEVKPPYCPCRLPCARCVMTAAHDSRCV